MSTNNSIPKLSNLLIITEKRNQAIDISKELGSPVMRDSYIACANGVDIAWGSGHLLTMPHPDKIREEWAGAWRYEMLPMFLEEHEWCYEPLERTKKQLFAILDLLKKHNHVVIATDAGREGELIGRLILKEANRKFKWLGRVDRFWVSSLVPAAIRDGLNNLIPGDKKKNLYKAAVLRSRIDYLFGMNGSRIVNIKGRPPQRQTLHVGRVKLAVLSELVNRENAIRDFVPKDFAVLTVELDVGGEERLCLSHSSCEFANLQGDEKFLIGTKEDAEILTKQAKTQSASLKVEKTHVKKPPSCAYDLTKLQIDANKIFGLSAQETLDIAQKLYDEKKVLTYPRVDNGYLTDEMVSTVKNIVTTFAPMFKKATDLITAMGGINTGKHLFNSAKVTEGHHAIIPTGVIPSNLNEAERKIFALVCLKLYSAISCAYEADKTKISADFEFTHPFKHTRPFSVACEVPTQLGFQNFKINQENIKMFLP